MHSYLINILVKGIIMWGEVARSLELGNGYMATMILFLFFAIIIIVERFIMLQYVFNLNFHKFLSNLKKMIASNDLNRAINLCKSVRATSLPKIALRALEAAETDPTTIKGTIEEESIEFLPRIESRLAILPAIATLIMLIGILGTIDGLWNAFYSVDVLDTAKKQASLASGISGSLNPTAFGLMICMLILVCHQILKSSAIRLTERIYHGVAVLNNVLVPAEVATYVSAGPMEQMSVPMETSQDGLSNNQADDEGDINDDAFDDASVEDIKDEEEII
jgi:biopolymer transport protein ExbB/TolQ